MSRMRRVQIQKTHLIDQLQALTNGLRAGSIPVNELPRSLILLLRQMAPSATPTTSEWIESDSGAGRDPLEEARALMEAPRAWPEALDLDNEPPIELVSEGHESSAHSAAELLGLDTPGGSGTRRLPLPTRDDSQAPQAVVGDPERDGVRLHPIPASRYDARELLGTGGQGDVREVFDRFLQRGVALKALRDDLVKQPHSRSLFLREACLTAQLTHPCIVPIYDVGELASGAPCYTMKRIRGRSLRDVLQAIRRGEPWSNEYTRRRLIEILVQVAHAVGYAHDRGVVHRDLKPANLMVGDYGEVLVVDWGIARVLSLETTTSPEGPVALDPALNQTLAGTIKGTPAYMAPEQARGERDAVGPWTDVHALGLILHEILTGEPVRPLGSAEDVVVLARRPTQLSPEKRRIAENLPVDPIPEELDQICMSCLAAQPEMRYQDGEALARALRAYLEGQRRRDLAEMHATEGEARAASVKDLEASLSALQRELAKVRQQTDPWASLEEKRALWDLEAKVQEAERIRDEASAQAIACFTQALDEDPDNHRGRAGLAQIYFSRLLESESLGRVREARQLEDQVRRLDDGKLKLSLEGCGSLLIDTAPDRGEAWLYRYELVDRVLRPTEGQRLGRTPIEVDPLPMGRYLVVIRMRGGREVHYPVLIRRQARWEGLIRLRPELDERFIHIPAGPGILGGDRLAPGSLPREERWIDDFAIARLPITCKEYLRFLHSLPLGEAYRHVPRTSKVHGGVAWWPVENGHFQIPRVDEAGGRWDPRYPVRHISRLDAEAYAAWRSGAEGLSLRLPTEFEWEKAGRGVDGRFFPWGDAFDATFCKMRESRPGKAEPEPAGAFLNDRSPYGVQDMAGSISEWCSGSFDRYQLLGVIRGGYWRGAESTCRLARRFASDPEEPAPFAGFRLVLELGPGDTRP